MLISMGLLIALLGLPGIAIVVAVILYLTREQRRVYRRKVVLKKAAKGDFRFMTKRERDYAQEYAEQNPWMDAQKRSEAMLTSRSQRELAKRSSRTRKTYRSTSSRRR